MSGNQSDKNIFDFVLVLLPVRKPVVCYFYSNIHIYIHTSIYIYIYFQGQDRIRPDISGIADLGKSIERRDKTCPGRAHLSPDEDGNDHRYRTK